MIFATTAYLAPFSLAVYGLTKALKGEIVNAVALKRGRKTIEVSRRGASYLWGIAASHYLGKPYWTIGVIRADLKNQLEADGWRVVPVEVKELA